MTKRDIAYSDGDTESQVWRILTQVNDDQLSSQKTIGKDFENEWGVHYHLSEKRGHLLRGFNLEDLEVLEIGAGMGAVSRSLAERCKHLTVIEGSNQRYLALKERLRNLNNWNGYVGNFQEINIEKKFDVVCLIGVLEYSQLFINAKNPFNWCIDYCKSYLKEGGVLIVAIENKNGLKYYGGAHEDHLGIAYSGITGYPPSKSPKTFSRNELMTLIKDSKGCIDLFYPFPDYKLPNAILSHELAQINPTLFSEIAADNPTYPHSHRHIQFPESLAFTASPETEHLANISNSLLVMYTKGSATGIKDKLLGTTKTSKNLGWIFSSGRIKNTLTIISTSHLGCLISRKGYLYHPSKGTFTHVIDGVKVSTVLFRTLYHNDINSFYSIMKCFLAKAFALFQSTSGSFLKPSAIDAIPRNCILKDNEYVFFDLEHKFSNQFTKTHFILRALLYLDDKEPSFNKLYAHEKLSIKLLYQYFCNAFNLQDNFSDDCIKEARFMSQILDSDYYTILNQTLARAQHIYSKESSFADNDKRLKREKKKTKRLRYLLSFLVFVIFLLLFF